MIGVVTQHVRSALAHTATVLGILLIAVPAGSQTNAPSASLATPPPAPNDTLSPAAAPQRLAALRAEIAHHDELYFRQAAPEISDFAYDQLKRELAELERALPAESVAASPPAEALSGDDRTGGFPLARHRERMLSLDKTYSEAELRGWYAGIVRRLGRTDLTFTVEPKFDGIAVCVTYERGQLVRAVTRGNGWEGDDITANVRTIRPLSPKLRRTAPDGSPNPVPDLIELRGELYVPWAEFRRINHEQEAAEETPFANPRNLAAGTAKSGDPRVAAARRLAIVFYGWGGCEPAALQPATQRAFLAQVRAWGLPTVEDFRVGQSIAELWTAVQSLGRARDQLAFPIDGAVVKLDAVPPRRELGETDRAPRWAMAYKFAPANAETRLLDIAIQVGRTGVLTPVAKLAPVELGGSTVARATLHNRAAIARLGLCIGDAVILEKAGEIIPQITGVDRDRRPAGAMPYVFPENCPACGAPVIQLAGEAAVRCPNSACPAQLRRRLQHFASKAGVDISGLGPATAEALVAHGLVTNVADLYRLRRADLLALPHTSGANADALLASIERSKGADLGRFIVGLGIPHVGAATAKALARQFGRLDALATASAGQLAPVVGEDTAQALVAHFNAAQNRAVIEELLAAGVHPGAPKHL